MTPEELKKLAVEATDGPFGEAQDWVVLNSAQAQLCALASDLALLVAELGEALRHIEGWAEDELLHGPPELGLILGESRIALARLSELTVDGKS